MSNKNRIDTIIDIKRKVEHMLEEMGFEKVTVGDSVVYLDNKNHHFHRIDYIGGEFNSLVIETALDYEDAVKNIFEDGELYSLSLGEDKILLKIKEDLIKYYLN